MSVSLCGLNISNSLADNQFPEIHNIFEGIFGPSAVFLVQQQKATDKTIPPLPYLLISQQQTVSSF